MEASRSLMSVIPLQPFDLLQDSAADNDIPRLVPDDRSLQFDDGGCLIILEHYLFEIGGVYARPHESTSTHASTSSASRSGPGQFAALLHPCQIFGCKEEASRLMTTDRVRMLEASDSGMMKEASFVSIFEQMIRKTDHASELLLAEPWAELKTQIMSQVAQITRQADEVAWSRMRSFPTSHTLSVKMDGFCALVVSAPWWFLRPGGFCALVVSAPWRG